MKRLPLAVLILLLVAVGCWLLPPEAVSSLQRGKLSFTGSVLRVFEGPLSWFRKSSTANSLPEAQAQIKQLLQEKADLQIQNQLLTANKAETDRLREMLGYRNGSPYRLRACHVISRDPTTWWDVVQIDVGWQDEPDIKPDEPVVTPRGVVGKIGQVSAKVSDVILIINRNCQIPAIVESTRDQGFTEGEGNTGDAQPRVKVTYLPKNSAVAPGNFVDTSGLGPFFPAGLHIGTVTEVSDPAKTYPTFGLYREAHIDPTADLNQLDELFIILGTQKETDPAVPTNPTPTPSDTSR